MLPPTLRWDSETKTLILLDQRNVPDNIAFRECRSFEDVALSIEDMTVRGAPAIGVAAAYGAALAAMCDISTVECALARLAATRPTAVNLYWAIKRMRNVYDKYKDDSSFAEAMIAEAVKIHSDDIMINKKLSFFGQEVLPGTCSVITHCNAGALATAGYGTALGVFRAAAESGKKLKIYADETRPRLQGGRLTAFELFEDGFDVTVICDSMAAFLMSKKKIDAVVTGADRIAANGDTANKIGTYALAIAAKFHNVPFYIAAPVSTIDINCPTGESIPIEERSSEEVHSVAGAEIIPKRIDVWNPAFDVTPSDLITGIITEGGVIRAPYTDSINKIVNNI